MSTLLYSLGRWSFRHPWRVLLSWVLLLALAAGGAALLAKGTDNSFSIPGTESQAGLEQLNRTFPQVSGTSAQFIVVAADGDAVTDADYHDAIENTVGQIEDLDGVLAVTDPYSDTVRGNISDDETAAIVRMQFDGQATNVPAETVTALEQVVDELGPELPSGAQVQLGGDLFAVSLPGVTVTELVGLLIALLVLIATFRSFVVAGLPLLTAILGVGLSMALIFVATAFASVSSTTPLLALMLGLAVGIDYSLFIISRHQDQTRAGADPEESAARATGTAGSAVVFAGITVLIALIGLSFAGIPFLTTMGVAAAVAVAIAVAVAVTLTPALLGLVKGRVLGWRRRAAKKTDAATTPARRGFATRWVGLVTRHPLLTTIAVVVTLGVATIPAASLALALPNAGQLPKDDAARITYDLTTEHFGPGANGPLIMTGTIVTSNDPVTLMTEIGDEIAALPGVKEVALATPNEAADTGIVQIVPETAPDDPATADLVRELRAQHDRLLDEYGVDLKVTGFTAVAIDISDRLGQALLPFGLFVVGLSLILLMIVFRSVWVPLKAALGYLLSVGASFGVVAAVFEWGWFADLLHVARTGPVISFMPIVVMGVLFGLAMDYEVFLVSRMREDYVHALRRRGGGSAKAIAVDAVRSGFSASARVVTAAAVIMFAVFAAFVPEGDSNLKPIALGLATGVAIDAFLVRMTLVPAVMTLLGDRAWWFPRWLDRLLPHFDIEGEAVERELALADWPAEPAAITAEGVTVRAWNRREGEVTVLAETTFRVRPGHCLVVTGPRESRRALALAVAGRADPSDGRMRVAGRLVPERAGWVRRNVGIALLGDSADPGDELRQALGARANVVVIDGLDLLEGAARAQAVDAIRDAALLASERADDARTALTLVVTAADSGRAQALLTDALRPHVQTLEVLPGDASASASDLASAPEVTA
ncbi:efflux RND transporter permease subunit [Microbacterium sp. cx-55]|uniref:efflux RND transporter permease subunit n=1 Tax=Microbacterium sp. cx-55 TaxID=2875948 RepID=UPI001CBCB9D1|nr:efflux RND transporter permease subunit [Microbacterium sp. cx-55]MBZ4487856.1 MMPL family transporter [Microbacterium sp. cx-55]UGB34733.1 efflux RND transporter permease subunit [Microbacterium sp. cx-55]